MRHKDPELMKRIQAFAEDFYFEEGRSPSTAEIGKAVGIAKGTAHRYLVEMSEKGQIDYDGKTIETEKTRRLSPTSRAEIFTGAIPCGPLETVEASADEYAKLPTAIFGSGDFYIIRTTGMTLSVKRLICFCCPSTLTVSFLPCSVSCTHLIVKFFITSFNFSTSGKAFLSR